MSDVSNTGESAAKPETAPQTPQAQAPAAEPNQEGPQQPVHTQPNIAVNQITSPRVVVISVRMSEKERGILEKLTQYLYKSGKIQDPSMSEAMRLCLYFTTQEVAKAIEAERYGQG